MKKPESTAAWIHNAREAGIEASCVLMDTWFTNEPFIHAVLSEGLDVIGMVKDNKQQYSACIHTLDPARMDPPQTQRR